MRVGHTHLILSALICTWTFGCLRRCALRGWELGNPARTGGFGCWGLGLGEVGNTEADAAGAVAGAACCVELLADLACRRTSGEVLTARRVGAIE